MSDQQGSKRQQLVLAAYAAKGVDNPWKAYIIDKLVVGNSYKQGDEDNPIDAIERLIDMEVFYSQQSLLMSLDHEND